MVGLIPRLVLDEDEVSKIIHDVFDDAHGSNRKSDAFIGERNENDSEDDSGNKNEEFSRPTSQIISLPSVSIETKELVDEGPEIERSLSERSSSTVNAVTTFVLEKLTYACGVAGDFSSSIAKLHFPTLISKAVDVIKDLPHRATFQWRHLLGVLTVMVLCPLLGEVVFFLPMNSVNYGPEENQVFIYGIMTLYQLFMQLPWVETCNFGMPEVNIPTRARVVALFVGLTIAKFIDLILTMGIFTYEPVFPIPFSILVTGNLGTLTVVPILYFLTPRMDREQGKFRLMFAILVAYWVALLVVIGWAIGIQRLQGQPLQYLVLVSYAILRFICKVLLCANISTRLQPKRHIQLNLVVDILFTRVQVATWPFIDSPFTLMALFASESSVILWRYWNGVDRMQLWLGSILTAASLDRNEDNISKRKRMKGITEACLTGSNQYIINMCLSEDKEDVIRNLTTCKTSSTLGNSSFTRSNDSEGNQDDIEFCGDEGSSVELPCIYHTKRQDQNSLLMESSYNSKIHTKLLDEDIELCAKAGIYEVDSIKMNTSTCPGVTDIMSRSDHIIISHSHDDDDSSTELTIQKNGRINILRRPVEDDNGKDDDIDELVDIDLREEMPSFSQRSTQETWEQRDLYHMVDSTGSLCVNIIVRINQQLIFVAVRNLPSSEHLNESFQISDDRWQEAQIYGSTYVILMLLLVIGINFSSVFFSKKEGLEGKKLSLGRVLSYLFKDNFWYFFFWLISTGALVSSAMVNHFGADFSMNFTYLSCLEEIEWPGCPSD